MVCDSRSVLFDYCEMISAEHFIKGIDGFGRGGSMRNLLVHVANSSQYWIGNHCFSLGIPSLLYTAYCTVAECRQLFRKTDELVYQLLDKFEDDYNKPITSSRGDQLTKASPLKVFLHAITHEYHHKGQIVSISRQLGYSPVDTDVIR